MKNGAAKASGSRRTFKAWRALVNSWTMVFFAAVIYDYLNGNALAQNESLLAIAAIYTALLAFYSADKEFRRWHDKHHSIHPGELYALLWTMLIAALIVGDAFYDPSYKMPAEVSASYIGVIGILAITRASRNFYRRERRLGR